MSGADKAPGPWRVEPWSGGEKHAAGFYVARILANGRTEWMISARSKHGRARRFKTVAEALAAIAALEGSP